MTTSTAPSSITKKSRLVSQRATIVSPPATRSSVESVASNSASGGLEPREHGHGVADVRMGVVPCRGGDRLRRLEEGDHPLDVVRGARVVEDAEAQRRQTVHARRRDEADAALLERGDEAVRQPLVVVAGTRAPAEADDAERDRCGQLELLARLDPVPGELREIEAAIDRGSERVEPERAQREPELERPRRPRQLQAEIGEVDLLRASRRRRGGSRS